jgi:hypothetical protein
VECDPAIAAARNTHGVPRETVLRMARMMQDPPKFWDATFRSSDLSSPPFRFFGAKRFTRQGRRVILEP